MAELTEYLFVGSLDDAYNQYWMDKVTHMLNVAEELTILDRVNHQYMKMGVEDDDPEEDIRRILPACIAWIDDAVSNGGKVMVHCLEGKSRSVCVCLTYLCIREQLTLDEAMGLIRSKRPCIDIFPAYLEQVRSFVEAHDDRHFLPLYIL